MRLRFDRTHGLLATALLVALNGCQLIDKIRNARDSGASTARTTPPVPTPPVVPPVPTPPVVPPVPTPTVPPVPTVPVAAQDAAAPAPVAAGDDAGNAAPVAAGDDAGGAAPTVATPTPPEVPTTPEGPPGTRPRRRSGWCKDHPGRMNPYTGVICPM